MIKYRFDLLRGGIKIAELDLMSIQYGYARNDFQKCTFIYNANNLDPTIEANLIKGSELQIFRKGEDDSELRLVWAGEIQTPKRSINENNEKTIDCTVVHWGEVFFRTRFPTIGFEQVEESQIAWGLVNEAQTNTFEGQFTPYQVTMGISQGTLENTNNPRDRTYIEAEVLTALQQLADVLDISPNPQVIRGFRLTPDLLDSQYRYFHYYGENYGISRSDVVFTNPVINDVSEADSLEQFANVLTANGNENTVAQTAITTNQDNLNFFKYRRGYIDKTNIETEDSLFESAQEELQRRINLPIVYEVAIRNNNPFIGKFREGDLITIRYEDDKRFINLDSIFRVYEITISYDDKGIESVNLKIAEDKPVITSTDSITKLIVRSNTTQDRLTELERRQVITTGYVELKTPVTFDSASAPTFTMTADLNLTTFVDIGMKIKLTQDSTTKYFIITAIDYSSGQTTITMYGGNFTLTSSPISNVFYSTSRAPLGFPLDPNVWTEKFKDTILRSQSSPAVNTWYNLGGISISLPVGIWEVEYSAAVRSRHTTGGLSRDTSAEISLSADPNAESDEELTARSALITNPVATQPELHAQLSKNKPMSIEIAAKTYYTVVRTTTTGVNDIALLNDLVPLIIRAKIAYL